jgi:hypothetical protein
MEFSVAGVLRTYDKLQNLGLRKAPGAGCRYALLRKVALQNLDIHLHT